MAKAPKDTRNDALVGRRLKALREATGLTQSALARTVGVSPSTISEWESGEKHLDVNVARRMAKKHGFSLDYLYCGYHEQLPLHLALAVKADATAPTERD
jgi:transcriptional regulator with XRE-family HTH domain